MSKGRLEAFSDGVIAIIITIMVLELKVPHVEGHDVTLAALGPLAPIFLSYVLSFIFVGIYWNNHHHLFQACKSVNGAALWANLHLLFWLSLLPFVSGFMGENGFAQLPVILYGMVLLMCAVAYTILVRTLLSTHPGDSTLARAIGSDTKGKISLAIYSVSILLCLIHPWLGFAGYVIVAIIWFIPDRRIESKI